MSQRGVPVLVAFLLFLVSACFSTAFGEGCGAKGDWKDIYILPTNPNADTNIKISLSASKTHVQPGETITFTIEADRDCYVTIMDMGTSGRIVRLWPNQYSQGENLVKAHTPRRFPSEADRFQYKIGGPSGVERIIAYATSQPGKILSESEFQTMQNTPFKQFVGGAKDLSTAFTRETDSLTSNIKWGSAQVNICIGSGESFPSSPDAGGVGVVYLLAVGAPTGKLKYCNRDAQRFADVMKSKLGVKEANLRLILGSEATYAGFAHGLEWLAATTKPEDSAIIYFSGHGSSIPDQPPLDEEDGRDEAFVLYPGQSKDYRAAIRDKIIMVDDDFNVKLKKIPARKKVIVADCCHSGTIHKTLGSGDEELVCKYMPFRDPDTGQEIERIGAKAAPTNYGNDNEAILAACLDNQSSFEVAGRQAGLFTDCLIEAINKGADNLEKAFEMAKAMTEKAVGGLGRQSQGGSVKQTPHLTDPHGYVKLFKFSR